MARGLICIRSPDDEAVPPTINKTDGPQPDPAPAPVDVTPNNPDIPDAPAMDVPNPYGNGVSVRPPRQTTYRQVCGTALLWQSIYRQQQYNGGDNWWEPACIPLVAVDVRATIHDFCAEVTVQQIYVNTERRALETSYVFPLDENSAVCKFEAEIAGGIIRGVVKEKAEAKADYNRAVSSGRHAALMSQSKSANEFVCEIGNLMPNESCIIRFTYVTQLQSDATGALRFVLPTTVCPPAPIVPWFPWRTGVPAISQWFFDPVAYIADRTMRVQRGEDLPYRLSMRIDVTMPTAITSITSPSHGIVVEDVSTETPPGGAADDSKAQRVVTFADAAIAMDKEVVILVEQADPWVARALVERISEADSKTGEQSLALQVTFCERALDMADAMAIDLPTELTFLVDVSGSMGGAPIASTRNTLHLFMRSLPEKARFNIITFNDYFGKCFPDSVPYNDTNLQAATKFIDAIVATGGTEILTPLEWVLKKPLIAGHPRQVFVLTDGQVSNTAEVIRAVKRHAATTRVFTMGIGTGVSKPLCEGMAYIGNGTVEFVTDNDKIAEKVSQQLARALQPPLTNVTIDWGGAYSGKGRRGAILNSPQRLPDIFPGARYFAYGTVTGERAVFPDKFFITVSCREKKTWTIPARLGRNIRDTGTMVHVLAAKARVKELSYDAPTPARRTEITALGLRHQILTEHTSFVAVSTMNPVNPNPQWLAQRSVDIGMLQQGGQQQQQSPVKFGFGSSSSMSTGSTRQSYPSAPGSFGGGGGGSNGSPNLLASIRGGTRLGSTGATKSGSNKDGIVGVSIPMRRSTPMARAGPPPTPSSSMTPAKPAGMARPGTFLPPPAPPSSSSSSSSTAAAPPEDDWDAPSSPTNSRPPMPPPLAPSFAGAPPPPAPSGGPPPPSRAMPPSLSTSDATQYLSLVKAQNADGSWPVTAHGSAMISNAIWTSFLASDDIKSGVAGGGKILAANASVTATEITAVLATVYGVGILETKYAVKKSEWSILVMKARTYITKRLMAMMTTNGGAPASWSAVTAALINHTINNAILRASS